MPGLKKTLPRKLCTVMVFWATISFTTGPGAGAAPAAAAPDTVVAIKVAAAATTAMWRAAAGLSLMGPPLRARRTRASNPIDAEADRHVACVAKVVLRA